MLVSAKQVGVRPRFPATVFSFRLARSSDYSLMIVRFTYRIMTQPSEPLSRSRRRMVQNEGVGSAISGWERLI